MKGATTSGSPGPTTKKQKENELHVDHIDVVTGGQYGSEGKGAVADALVKRWKYDCLIRVAGPNAGHTVIDSTGTPRALRTIPAAGINDYRPTLYIGPGSEVDLQVLQDDIAVYQAADSPLADRLYVDPEATIVTEADHDAEALAAMEHGSTRKGVGSARARRAYRLAPRAVDYRATLELDLGVIVGRPDFASRAMVEGTQGYWLGSHAGLYPYCTSSDCRAIDFLAMAGCTWNSAVAYTVFRSYPIRIAGNSGPLERETTWEALGLKPEITTVTKKVRRVGQFEPGRTLDAIHGNRIGNVWPRVAFTFMDYLDSDPAVQEYAAQAMLGSYGGLLSYIGNGPASGVWV